MDAKIKAALEAMFAEIFAFIKAIFAKEVGSLEDMIK